MTKQCHISTGKLGEHIAEQYYIRHGYTIISRNCNVKVGELDIVAQKDGVLHFVEVKSGTWTKMGWPHEGDDLFRPEDHMHQQKCARMARAIAVFMSTQRIPPQQTCVVDLVVVLIHTVYKRALVRVVPDIKLSE